MTVEDRFRERYQSGDTPWDAGQPDSNLIEVVTQKPIASCKAIEMGCGTGDNAIWLVQNRFHVIGIDASDIAIEKAKEKASKANVECDFKQVDFLQDKVDGAPFGFAFDRGCFHSFSGEALDAFNRSFQADVKEISLETAVKCCAVEIEITEMTGRREREQKRTYWRHSFEE